MQIRLPAPGADELAHSRRLCEQLAAEIRRDGPISFARYMEACLYSPGLGYYSAGATKFGASGDFVTAPELGSLFAATLADTVAPWLQRLGPAAGLLELGGGSGAMAGDVLLSLAEAGIEPAWYWILEPSADLRQRQREHLKQVLPPALWRRVRWLERLPEQDWQGVLLANEVIDALPATRFVVREEGICEEVVELTDTPAFVRGERPASAALVQQVQALQQRLGWSFPAGYRSELRPQLAAWMQALCQHWQQGLGVWVDYGFPAAEYYLPERDDGTLMAYYRHRAHADPFHLPGLDDLTASVNFSALAAAGAAAGLQLELYASQARWLLASGLQARFEAAYQASTDPRQQLALSRQVRCLTMPEQMGERFQVMLFSRGETTGVSAGHWAEIDQRRRL